MSTAKVKQENIFQKLTAFERYVWCEKQAKKPVCIVSTGLPRPVRLSASYTSGRPPRNSPARQLAVPRMSSSLKVCTLIGVVVYLTCIGTNVATNVATIRESLCPIRE